MYLGKTNKIMLELLRAAVLNRKPQITQDYRIDWDGLMDLALDQGLIALVWDGICMLPNELLPPRQYSINWALSAQEIVEGYKQKSEVLDDMIKICNENDMRLLLLKGFCLANLYPKPESRPFGDLDIFLFDDYDKGNKLFAESDINVGTKHSDFFFHGVHVENHRTFINLDSKLKKNVEQYLRASLLKVQKDKDGYYVLEPMANLVFLVMHSIRHLKYKEAIPLRNIIDIYMFLHSNEPNLNPQKCYSVFEQLGIPHYLELLILLGESALEVDMSAYHRGLVPRSDFVAAKRMLIDQDYIRNIPTNLTYFKQLRLRIIQANQVKWKYRYEPISKRVIYWGMIRLQIHLLFKHLFGFPETVPFSVSLRSHFKRV